MTGGEPPPPATEDEAAPSLEDALSQARREAARVHRSALWTLAARDVVPFDPAIAAWRIPRHRARIHSWLDEWPGGPLRLRLRVELRKGRVVEATFKRALRRYVGETFVVAACARKGAIFAARRLDAGHNGGR